MFSSTKGFSELHIAVSHAFLPYLNLWQLTSGQATKYFHRNSLGHSFGYASGIWQQTFQHLHIALPGLTLN